MDDKLKICVQNRNKCKTVYYIKGLKCIRWSDSISVKYDSLVPEIVTKTAAVLLISILSNSVVFYTICK